MRKIIAAIGLLALVGCSGPIGTQTLLEDDLDVAIEALDVLEEGLNEEE